MKKIGYMENKLTPPKITKNSISKESSYYQRSYDVFYTGSKSLRIKGDWGNYPTIPEKHIPQVIKWIIKNANPKLKKRIIKAIINEVNKC